MAKSAGDRGACRPSWATAHELPPHTSTTFSRSGSAWEISLGVRRTVMGMMSITTTLHRTQTTGAELSPVVAQLGTALHRHPRRGRHLPDKVETVGRGHLVGAN